LEGGEDLTLGDLKAKFITAHKAPSTPDKQSTGIMNVTELSSIMVLVRVQNNE